MIASTQHTTTILTYAFLYLSVLFLWVPLFKKIPLWIISFLLALVFGLVSQCIDVLGLLFIVSLAVAASGVSNDQLPLLWRTVAALLLGVLGLGLGLIGMHVLPGFNNAHVLVNVFISKDAIPFNLYLNFDKTTVGLFILGFLQQRITTRAQWQQLFKSMFPFSLLVILIVAVLSFLLHFVRFDWKIPSSLPLWAMTNLFFVCCAEEAFYRGFVQKYLSCIFRTWRYGSVLALVIAAVLFGLTHFMGGDRYVVLATVAGIGYGWIYWQTKRIEASILTHFFLNLIHFLCFTYPALA